MQIDVVGDTVCALVTATALAQTGHQVRLLLMPSMVADEVIAGRLPFHEPGLDRILDEQRAVGRLTVLTADQAESLALSDVLFIALQAGEKDVALELTRRQAASHQRPLLVNQSVFPVGTSEEMQLAQDEAGAQGAVVAFPDTLQDGQAWVGFVRPDHILLGCETEWAEALVRELLRPFNRRRDVIQVMSRREAEFAKLAISGMLATRVSFMSDMALLAEELDVDIEKVRQAMAEDPRIGDAYLYPGCGFGGPGFSRDVMSLSRALHQRNSSARLLDEVMLNIERQKEVLFRKFWRFFNCQVQGRAVAIWGGAFKPATNRIQNAPSLALIEALLAQGVLIRIYDPMALEPLSSHFSGRSGIEFCADAYQALEGVDALMLVTEWKEFWSPDWTELKRRMRTPLIIDGRNIYDPGFLARSGFRYSGIGRGEAI